MNKLRIAAKVWNDKGITGIAGHVLWRLTRKPPRILPACIEAVRGKGGLEIGGLTPLFSKQNAIPIYPHINWIHNCDFSSDHFGLFRYERVKLGWQFQAEATNLKLFPAGFYDFILSSHCLEHVANPLQALYEWKRVILPGGHLLLVVPHYRYTFDHLRPVTTQQHLLDDYERTTGEDDKTHVAEVLRCHDMNRDWDIENYAHLLARTNDNFNNRCLHHHVFDEYLVKWMLLHCGFEVIYMEFVRPFHIVVLARKRK